MILTGKCLEKFTIWMKKYPNIYTEQFETMPEWMINALIIDFFDSVGIYVNAIRYSGKFKPISDYELQEAYSTRVEAIIEAILKADEIFNNR